MKIDELNKKIIEWAKEREIDKKGTIQGQAMKTIEEMSELIKGICKNDIDLIKDSIGDVYVTLVIGCMLNNNVICQNYVQDFGRYRTKENMIEKISGQILNLSVCYEPYKDSFVLKLVRLLESIAFEYNTDLRECVELAYNEISRRKGKMINGVFVKEADLK